MKKIIYKLINDAIEGVDVYHHNGSFWLIFTDRKEWVIELDKSGKLWYRYQFFQNLFNYVSMDVIDNQHHITEWVEDMLKNEVMNTKMTQQQQMIRVEDTIWNGVKTTYTNLHLARLGVEDTIRNGVKTTIKDVYRTYASVEDTIRNGVKTTYAFSKPFQDKVEGIIQNGVNSTFKLSTDRTRLVDITIKDGIIF